MVICTDRKFRILSICSGVGGLDEGVKLAIPDARSVCYIEREAYCVSVLLRRMQEKSLDEAPVWDNLATFDGKPWRRAVDCIIGGIPCQPASNAGKRKGDADDRWLWGEATRIVSEILPPLFFFENVSGLVSGKLQVGFERILNDLQGLGYQIATGLFTASEVGATHKRERIFILGLRRDCAERIRGTAKGMEDTNHTQRRTNTSQGQPQPDGQESGWQQKERSPRRTGENARGHELANSTHDGLPGGSRVCDAGQRDVPSFPCSSEGGESGASQPQRCGRDGIQSIDMADPVSERGSGRGGAEDLAGQTSTTEGQAQQRQRLWNTTDDCSPAALRGNGPMEVANSGPAGYFRRQTADQGRPTCDQCEQPVICGRGPSECGFASASGVVQPAVEYPPCIRRGEGGTEHELWSRRDAPADPGLPLFPPGPADLDSWRVVLSIAPWLAPAVAPEEWGELADAQECLGDVPGITSSGGCSVETHAGQRQNLNGKSGRRSGDLSIGQEQETPAQCPVRGMADGLACRTHRLRANGNGVVPLQAAYALSVLWDAMSIS